MSPIAAGLDILLISLLLLALVVGLRLNKRLKALRDSQASFVAAVGELDVAASRAESGLKALRAASEDVHDVLLTRIETARGLIARLETASDAATRSAAVLAAPAAAPAAPILTTPIRYEPRAVQPARPLRAAPTPARGLDDDLFEADPAPDRLRRMERR